MTAPALCAQLARDGFVTLPVDPATARWAAAARAAALPLTRDPACRADWLRCAGTWFAGVDVLPNAPDGSIGGVPLAGPAIDLLADLGLHPAHWHAGQVSVIYPGYPRPREGESPTAARYRQRRDAAHLDGLHAVGPDRRRMLREPHAFILGLALSHTPPQAGPLVAWQGSHRILGAAMAQALAPHPVAQWPQVDVTEAYRTARRTCFERCARVELPGTPGQAVLLHRHCLHGMGPWPADLPDPGGSDAGADGRMVAYFRPLLDDPHSWIDRAA